MEISPIRTEAEYEAALVQTYALLPGKSRLRR